MKRLIKKGSNVVLYHGTNYEGLLGITNNKALIPHASEGAGPGLGRENNFYGFTFLATSIDKAFTYALSIKKDKLMAILELSLPESLLLPDDVDCPACKTWQESDKKIKQVKVSGKVSADYIKKISLYNPITNAFVIESTLESWQNDFEDNIGVFETDETNSNKIAEKIKNMGIEIEEVSFSDANDAFYVYNENIYDYGLAISVIDNTITKLYGIMDDDGQVEVSHYEQLLNTFHKGTKFNYEINTSLVTILDELESYIDEITFKIVFDKTTINYQNQFYSCDEFIDKFGE